MPSCKPSIAESFLASIPDEKLKNFSEHEYTIAQDYNQGFRLDHQGMNIDTNQRPYVHRLYLQPVGGTSSKAISKRHGNKKNKGIEGRCHATNTAEPEEIREALMRSFRDKKNKQVGYAPPK
ncbi:unnamed protein product [Clonostachys chloroleuca]|uniref:Uncharacterized protein n=1 Tax=Clonostachys chloroleuca TaxID=1926264 RepID=A0AA35LWY0_9HYPO|nr:unnamed protein product [Clonostachys chloroleuca]